MDHFGPLFGGQAQAKIPQNVTKRAPGGQKPLVEVCFGNSEGWKPPKVGLHLGKVSTDSRFGPSSPRYGHLCHAKFAQERLCLRDLVEQKRGSILCDEDADVVYEGVCNGVYGYIPRDSVKRVWVDRKCRVWIARTDCVPLEVRHRDMYTLQTRSQQHLEYIIHCIKDSAAWHRRTADCPLSVIS